MVKREHIISSAADMFITQGIKSVRIDDIAAALGMSKRTIYEMFNSREELLRECMYHVFVRKFCDTGGFLASLPNAVEAIFAILHKARAESLERERNERIRNNLQKFYPSVSQWIEEQIHAASHRHMCDLVERGMREGLFRQDTRVELSISILASSLTLMGMNKIRMMDNISLDEAFEYLVVNFFRGIATPRGAELIDECHQQYRNSLGRL